MAAYAFRSRRRSSDARILLGPCAVLSTPHLSLHVCSPSWVDATAIKAAAAVTRQCQRIKALAGAQTATYAADNPLGVAVREGKQSHKLRPLPGEVLTVSPQTRPDRRTTSRLRSAASMPRTVACIAGSPDCMTACNAAMCAAASAMVPAPSSPSAASSASAGDAGNGDFLS